MVTRPQEAGARCRQIRIYVGNRTLITQGPNTRGTMDTNGSEFKHERNGTGGVG